MKTENKLLYKVTMYLLLFLCTISISFYSTIYGVQSVQDVQESLAVSVNTEYNNSSDGNNNSIIHKKDFTRLNCKNTNSIINILCHVVGTISTIILFIQINESYFYEQDYFLKIYKRSLIAQKVRLNN